MVLSLPPEILMAFAAIVVVCNYFVSNMELLISPSPEVVDLSEWLRSQN